jgi:hypothetical protein
MASLTPAELQEARKRSGRLGGRPRKPTVEEARQAALEELTPKALKVLKAHLGEGDEVNPHAWRAALRVFEHAYGRAPEQPFEADGLPQDPDEIAGLSWVRMKILAAKYSEELRNPQPPTRSDIRLTRLDDACNRARFGATPD